MKKITISILSFFILTVFTVTTSSGQTLKDRIHAMQNRHKTENTVYNNSNNRNDRWNDDERSRWNDNHQNRKKYKKYKGNNGLHKGWYKHNNGNGNHQGWPQHHGNGKKH